MNLPRVWGYRSVSYIMLLSSSLFFRSTPLTLIGVEYGGFILSPGSPKAAVSLGTVPTSVLARWQAAGCPSVLLCCPGEPVPFPTTSSSPPSPQPPLHHKERFNRTSKMADNLGLIYRTTEKKCFPNGVMKCKHDYWNCGQILINLLFVKRLLNQHYPWSDFISKFKEGVNHYCCFCEEESETILHIFFKCGYTNLFWSQD